MPIWKIGMSKHASCRWTALRCDHCVQTAANCSKTVATMGVGQEDVGEADLQCEDPWKASALQTPPSHSPLELPVQCPATAFEWSPGPFDLSKTNQVHHQARWCPHVSAQMQVSWTSCKRQWWAHQVNVEDLGKIEHVVHHVGPAASFPTEVSRAAISFLSPAKGSAATRSTVSPSSVTIVSAGVSQQLIRFKLLATGTHYAILAKRPASCHIVLFARLGVQASHPPIHLLLEVAPFGRVSTPCRHSIPWAAALLIVSHCDTNNAKRPSKAASKK